jgi:hypothetical protein
MADTAITKAIQQLQSKITEYDGVDNAATCFNDAIQILTDLLPYERETIEAAHKDWQFTNAENYFTKTYNQ